jgi:phosphatidylglycerophosphatase C
LPLDPTQNSSVEPHPGVVALFDFDGTVTHCDSLMPFLRLAAGRARFWAGLIHLSPALLGYAFGRTDRAALKQAVLGQYIGGWPADRLRDTVQRFTATALPALCRDEAVERIRWHHDRGDRVLIISASPDAYLAPWAATLPIEAVLATRLEIRDGTVTGRIDGRNCRGAEKVARLAEYLGGLEGYEFYAYGDSDGDREILALADADADAETHAFYRPFRQRGAGLAAWITFLKALL